MITESYCQENIFINSNPTNNPDSLETWLKENPKPTITRLRNLFKLQKTYLWTTSEKSVVEEFGQLSKQLHNSSGIEFYSLLKALHLNTVSKSEEAKLYFSNAMNLIENESSPIAKFTCYTYCALIFNDTKRISDNKLSKKYVEKANTYLKFINNPHDKLYYLFVNLFIEIYSKEPNQGKIAKLFGDIDDICYMNPETKYSTSQMGITKILTHIMAKQFKNGIEIGEKLLTQLKKDDHHQNAKVYYFIAICYSHCGMIEKAKFAFNQALLNLRNRNKNFVSNQGNTTNYEFKLDILVAYRDFAKSIFAKSLVNSLADSIILYKSLETKEANDRAILEIQSQYNLSKIENEKKIAFIQANQKIKENYALYRFLIFASVLITLMVYLLFRLQYLNKKLKILLSFRDQFYTIFTHDIRKSINSLATTGSMLKYLIDNKKTNEIEVITQQISWMSSSTLQLVDNILDWGISNGYIVDATPIKTNITETIQDIFRYYKASIANKKIEIVFDIEDSLIIKTSKNCFEIIFRNMLSNAQNHTPIEGKITIKANYINNMIRVSIENTMEEIQNYKIDYINQIFNDVQHPAVGEKGLGLGIILMKTYADKNNTKLTASISSNNSVVFSMNIINESK